MKIISGSLKGRNIKGYDIEGTRPTMNRVKESIFAIIQNELKNSICLDLFCGSGNLGIEAISNGSKLCYFVDNNDKVIKIVNENITNLNIKDKTKVYNFDYKKSIKYFSENNLKFDIIFVDPPYDYHIIDKILTLIDKYNILNDNGIVLVEFEKEKLQEKYGSINLIKEKKYSWKYVYIYQKTKTL